MSTRCFALLAAAALLVACGETGQRSSNPDAPGCNRYAEIGCAEPLDYNAYLYMPGDWAELSPAAQQRLQARWNALHEEQREAIAANWATLSPEERTRVRADAQRRMMSGQVAELWSQPVSPRPGDGEGSAGRISSAADGLRAIVPALR